MSNENAALLEKIDRMEAALSSLASSTLEIASRIDLLRQETGRSAAQLQRVGLNQESFKLAGQRRDAALEQISDELAIIRNALVDEGK